MHTFVTGSSEQTGQSAHVSRSTRWLNAGVHWISAFVLLYAFLINGETTRAMVNSAAMKGEVKTGIAVGVVFLVRFLWVHTSRSGGGRWARNIAVLPQSMFKKLIDWAIYLGVAGAVITGFLIAYLRPGAVIIPGTRGFLTHSPALNAAINAHVFVTDALEWLCAFHVAWALWHWYIRESPAGRRTESYLIRLVSARAPRHW